MEKIEKSPKKPRISKQSIKNEILEMKPEVNIINNLRYIKPYVFTHKLWVKGRWIHKSLISVLTHEFKQFSEDYFLEAIKDGRILINSTTTTADYILQKSDFLIHSVIREEHPILNCKIDIIYEDEDYVVVDKPSSWPVHVCGGYQFNTLHRILIDDYGFTNLKMLHRLDKHTSGIVIMAKHAEGAEKFRKSIMERTVQKTYFARVKGNFTHDKIVVVRAIKAENKAKGMYTDCDDILEKDYTDEGLPLREKDNGLNKKTGTKDGVIDPDSKQFNDEETFDAKYAETHFEKLFYDEKSNTTVVTAAPKTGRTHQIRIHLRFLGFPIANDPCYGGIVFNDLKEFDNPDFTILKKLEKTKIDENESLAVSEIYSYKIWLHAWKYKFNSFQFESKVPSWAKENYFIDYEFKQ